MIIDNLTLIGLLSVLAITVFLLLDSRRASGKRPCHWHTSDTRRGDGEHLN